MLLSCAAGNGHEAVVKLLLATNEVNDGSDDNNSRTPLYWTIENNHENVIKLLTPFT